MNVDLTPELELVLQQQLETGRYGSVNDVLRDALRLLSEIDRDEALRRDEIRNLITQGMYSLRQGDHVDGDSVFGRLETELSDARGHKTA